MPNPFALPGEWLRGNLHTHTTETDGELSPQDTIATYRELGYDFLALTDHGLLSHALELDWLGLTAVRGTELAIPDRPGMPSVHMVALGIDEIPWVAEDAGPQEALGAVVEASRLVFIAHPSWSLLEAANLLQMEGYLGVEVFNQTCRRLSNRGHSESQWDVMLYSGCTTWGLAVDDCHLVKDMGQGWIMARCQERTEAAILAAVESGSFYASMGPELRGLELRDGEIVVRCSPCAQAAVIGAAPGSGRTSWYMEDLARPFEEVALPVPSSEAWLHVEIMDEQGRKAWSNPFRPEELQ